MKLTVVFDDKIIIKDGVIYEVDAEDWSLTQGNMHAVQWQDTSGHIEFNNGTVNQILSAESEVQLYSNFFDSMQAAYASRAVSLASIDQRYYVLGDLDRSTNTYASTAKDLATIQIEQVADIKREANRLLQKTDWYMIRYFELGPSNSDGAVPSAVSTYRQQIRAASHTYCTALLAASDFSAATSVADVSWPTEIDSNTYYLSE